MANIDYSKYVYGNRMPAYQNPDVSAKDLNNAAGDTAQQQEVVSGEGSIIPLIYGRQRVGAKLFAITSFSGSLVIGCAFCEGEVDAIEEIDINDLIYTDPSLPGVQMESFNGTTSQTASAILSSALSGYTDTLRYTIAGTTEVASTCYAAAVVPPGIITSFPRVTAVIRGKKVYDPRDGNQTLGTRTTYKYSNNPALCIADLITSTVYGLGKTVDWTSVALTANFNDQYVGPVGVQEKSRQLDIILDREEDVAQTIEVLRAYASCFVVEENGIYTLVPDKAIGYASNFSGVAGSYGVIPYNAAQSASTQVSFELTVKADIALTAASACCFCKGTSTSNDTIGFFHDKSSNTSTVLLRTGSAADGTGGARYTLNFTNTMPTTGYQTISYSYNSTGNINLVAVNGVTATLASSATGAVTNTTHAIQIGYIAGNNYWTGQVDELRIWNRYRPLAEIQGNYSKAIVPAADPSLIVHIPFNEGFDSAYKNNGNTSWLAISTALDKTGNTTGATLYPTPTYGTASSNWSQYDNPADFYRFDQNNIIADSTKFKRRGVANIPTIVEIAYTDQSSKPWRENYARLDMSSYNNNKRRTSNVSMLGITRYTQAYRECIERYNNIVSDSTVQFGAWDDSLALQIGDAIQFHHPIIEVWNSSSQAYSEIFKPYRLISIKEKDFSRYEVAAIEYDPQNYSTVVASTPTFPDTNLPKIDSPPTPSSVVGSEKLYKSLEGVWSSRVAATVTPSTTVSYPYTKGFLFKLYRGSGETQYLIEQVFINANTTAPSSGSVAYLSSSLDPFSDTDSINYPAQYQLAVHTVSTIDKISSPVGTTVLIYGKYNLPTKPSNFSVYEYGGKVIMSWGESVDIDVWRYEIKYGPTTADQTSASLSIGYAAANLLNILDSVQYTTDSVPPGTWQFYVKAIDSLGQYCDLPATAVCTVVSDNDAYGAITRKFSIWYGQAMTQWSARPDTKTYWSSDFGDHWRQGEAGNNNETAGFSLSGTIADTHNDIVVLNNAQTYLTIPHVTAYTAAATSTYIEAYIYSSGSVSGKRTIFSTMEGSAAGCWSLELGEGSATGTGYGRLYVTTASAGVIRESVDNVLKPNTWYHVALNVSSNTPKLYVDLEEVTYNGAGTGYTFNYNTNAKYVSVQNSSKANPFNGTIKRVKWYNASLSDADRSTSSEYHNNPTSPTVAGNMSMWAMQVNVLTDTGPAASNMTAQGTITDSTIWSNRSYIITDTWDYGSVISGNFVLNASISISSGTGQYYISTSADNTNFTDWAVSINTPVSLSARYIRLIIGLIGTNSNGTINDWPYLSILLSPKSESLTPIRTTSSGGKLVQLANKYAVCKSCQVTPINAGNAAYTVAFVDRLLVAQESGLKFTSEATASGMTGNCTFSTSTSYATGTSGRYLRLNAWLPPDTADLSAQFSVVIGYSGGGTQTLTPALTSGTWVTYTSGTLTTSSTIATVSILTVSNVVGIHSIVFSDIRITDSGGTLQKQLWLSGEPELNTYGGTMINKKCGPSNSFLLYAFVGNVQTALDTSIKFEGS